VTLAILDPFFACCLATLTIPLQPAVSLGAEARRHVSAVIASQRNGRSLVSAWGTGGILVVGLGRFGTALTQTLVNLGHEVLAVEANPNLVQATADNVTHVVEADATDTETMRQLGAAHFQHAVIAIGTNLEASILTAAVLVDLGVPEIWAKAITHAHGQILRRVGVHHVVLPEHEMGERVAHLVAGRTIESVELDDGFTLIQTKPPPQVVGKTLSQAQLRNRYGITVVCIKPADKAFTFATPDTLVGPDDILVVAGETPHPEKFAQLAWRSAGLGP
jgi:trk system potassium uptake protein TrkA